MNTNIRNLRFQSQIELSNQLLLLKLMDKNKSIFIDTHDNIENYRDFNFINVVFMTVKRVRLH